MAVKKRKDGISMLQLAWDLADFFVEANCGEYSDMSCEKRREQCLKEVSLYPADVIDKLESEMESLEEEGNSSSRELARKAEALAERVDEYIDPLKDQHYHAPFGSRKTRLFVDMDGTLAKFGYVESEEELYQKGYFLNLSPLFNVCMAVKRISKRSDIEVYILTSFLEASDYAMDEKNRWLNMYMKEILADHRIFVPCGRSKADFIPGSFRVTDVLLDDYTKNLDQWPDPRKAVKLLNGINGTKGTWKGNRISAMRPFDEIEMKLTAVLLNSESVNDAGYDIPEDGRCSKAYCEEMLKRFDEK